MLVRRPARPVLLLLLAAALTLASCNIGAAPSPTIDVNAISTAAYSTAIAQFSAGQTQTALAGPSATFTPTNTALSFPTFSTDGTVVPGANTAIPTFSFNNPNTTPVAGAALPSSTAAPGVPAAPGGATQSLGDACNNLAYLSDVTVPDNSELKPGINFQKVWSVKNTGSCPWDEGYVLDFIGGDRAMDPYSYVFSKKSDKDFVGAGETINLAINLTSPCTPGTYQGSWRMKNDKGYYFGTVLSIIFVVKTKCK